MKLLDYTRPLVDQDTLEIPVVKDYEPGQEIVQRRRRYNPMLIIRIVSLGLIFLVLVSSVLILFSYPNSLNAYFAPTPTPVYPQCAHVTVLLNSLGTPITIVDEVCK